MIRVCQSEKKYYTRAAEEYKRHLQKLVEGPQVSQHALIGRAESSELRTERSDSLDHTTWDAADGIDKLMISVSKSSTPVTPALTNASPSTSTPVSAPETVFRAAPVVSEAVSKAPESTAATKKPAAPEPQSVAPAAPLIVTLGSGTASESAKPTKSLGAKKPVTKKGLGAKKLGASPSDIRLESFEKVEKRSAKAAQEAADFEAAVALDKSENQSASESSAVSRVGAVYEDSVVTTASKPVQKGSIYTSDPAAASAKTGGSGSYPTSNGKSASYTNTSTSYAASDSRFSNKKGISSDQYFGRDQESESAMKGKLDKYSGATAISSDMLYHDAAAPDFGTVSYADTMAARARAGSGEVAKLKESVKSFFDDVSRNFG